MRLWSSSPAAMVFSGERRLSVPYLPLNRAPSILLFPLIDYVVEQTHFQSSTMLSTCHVPFVKSASTSFSTGSSFQKLDRVEALQISVDVGQIPTFGEVGQSKASIDSLEEAHADGCSGYQEDLCNKDSTELQRWKSSGQWSKGNIPWNKGIPHSEDTRKWISERTREALKDPKVKSRPKVRKKMREHPRPHSDRIKAKIGASQRKLWAKRLKAKRQKQKFFQSWAESISEIAKKGGNGEKELDWDSYNKILEEMTLLEIQRAVEERNAKAKAKEMSRMRAKAAQAKAEEMAQKMKERMKILAQKSLEREEKAKARVKKPRRSKEKKEELALARGRKLKHNLKKIHKRKSTNGLVHGQVNPVVPHIPVLEKLDLELIKKEKIRKEVSLADQLRAAKSKRAELAATDASGPVSYLGPMSQRSTNLR